MGGGADKKVLRLNVPMTDAFLVDVVQRSAHLVDIELHKQGRHPLPVFGIVLADPVDRLWHKL